MFKPIFRMFLTVLAVASLSLAMSACKPPQEDDFCSKNPTDLSCQGYNGGTGGTGGGGTGGGGTGGATTLAFAIKEAISLQANSDVLSTISKSKWKLSKEGDRQLFTAEKVENPYEGLSYNEALALHLQEMEGKAKGVKSKAFETQVSGSNLIAVAEDGSASLAVNTDGKVKFMYTVLDPLGEYVYMAVDMWDYQSWNFVTSQDCALFRVKVADNSFSCAAPGYMVQNIDDTFMKTVSGNQKPIQFDAEGSVYFAANTYEQSCTWPTGPAENPWQSQQTGTKEEYAASGRTDGWCNITSSTWNPQIYTIPVTDVSSAGAQTFGDLKTVSQDISYVQFFIVLSTGEVVYSATNQTDWTTTLSMYQKYTDSAGNPQGRTVQLSDTDWGVSFFAGDTSNAVMWGDWSTAGIKFARPRSAGGAEKAILDTTPFNTVSNTGYSYTATPTRIIVGDDGRLYGTFQTWASTYTPNGDTKSDGTTECTETSGCWEYNSVLSVYQMLPFDPIAKVQLVLGSDWWSWMGDTPFQISKGYLYYKTSEEVAFLGTRDVIKWVRLKDRATGTLLGGDSLYTIYNWRLSGGTLYFSALDGNTTSVVLGEIDIQAMKTAQVNNILADISAAIKITEFSSALGADATIDDIEVLKPAPPVSDPGGDALITKWWVTEENLFSLSLDFSNYMDRASVEANLTITDNADDASITYFPVWIYRTLHLIPDLSAGIGTGGPLSDKTTSPLKRGSSYKIGFADATADGIADNVADLFAWQLVDTSQALSVTLETPPTSGWYWKNDTSDESEKFSTGGVAKYAGSATEGEWSTSSWTYYVKEGWDLGYDFNGPIRLEFSAKNFGYEGAEVVLWNKTDYTTNLDNNRAKDASITMSAWSSANYKGETCDWSNAWEDTWSNPTKWYWCDSWKSGSTPDVFSGGWAKYRIDYFAQNIKFYVSTDGGTVWEEQTDMGAMDNHLFMNFPSGTATATEDTNTFTYSEASNPPYMYMWDWTTYLQTQSYTDWNGYTMSTVFKGGNEYYFDIPVSSADLSGGNTASTTVKSVTVNVDVTHGNLYYLSLYLISPSGDWIALKPGWYGTDGTMKDLPNITFDDSSTTSCLDTWGSTVYNAECLTTDSATLQVTSGQTVQSYWAGLQWLKGKDATGTWKLYLYDSYYDYGTWTYPGGTLNSFSVNITTGDVALTTTGASKDRADRFTFMLRAKEALELDNLTITQLDNFGNVLDSLDVNHVSGANTTSAFDANTEMDLDLSRAGTPNADNVGFDDNVNTTYGFSEW